MPADCVVVNSHSATKTYVSIHKHQSEPSCTFCDMILVNVSCNCHDYCYQNGPKKKLHKEGKIKKATTTKKMKEILEKYDSSAHVVNFM